MAKLPGPFGLVVAALGLAFAVASASADSHIGVAGADASSTLLSDTSLNPTQYPRRGADPLVATVVTVDPSPVVEPTNPVFDSYSFGVTTHLRGTERTVPQPVEVSTMSATAMDEHTSGSIQEPEISLQSTFEPSGSGTFVVVEHYPKPKTAQDESPLKEEDVVLKEKVSKPVKEEKSDKSAKSDKAKDSDKKGDGKAAEEEEVGSEEEEESEKKADKEKAKKKKSGGGRRLRMHLS